MWLVFSPLLSGGKIPGENPGEKPSLGSSWWNSNLWLLAPQSSALTNRPPTKLLLTATNANANANMLSGVF